jgi:hypothetical protein
VTWAQAKILLMRQHRDTELRLFFAGRIADHLTDNMDAVAAHQMDPLKIISILGDPPSPDILRRILQGFVFAFALPLCPLFTTLG